MNLDEKRFVEWKLKDSIIEIDKSSLLSVIISALFAFSNSIIIFYINLAKDYFEFFIIIYSISVSFLFLFLMWLSFFIFRLIKYSRYYNFLLQILLNEKIVTSQEKCSKSIL